MCEVVSDKRTAVLRWLQNIFGDEPVPSFHESEAFINHLHELMIHETRHEKVTQVYSDFITTSTRDYSDDLTSMVSVINCLGLTESIASPGAATDILASVANSLSLSSLEETSYTLALTDLLMSKEHTADNVFSLRNCIKDNNRNLAEALRVTNELETVLDKVSQQEGLSKDRNTSFLLGKATKYKADQRKQESKLSASGVTRDITHERLVADYNELQGLNSKLYKTTEELNKYAALPPDRQLAQVKLEIARSELRDLEDELTREIDYHHI